MPTNPLDVIRNVARWLWPGHGGPYARVQSTKQERERIERESLERTDSHEQAAQEREYDRSRLREIQHRLLIGRRR